MATKLSLGIERRALPGIVTEIAPQLIERCGIGLLRSVARTGRSHFHFHFPEPFHPGE